MEGLGAPEILIVAVLVMLLFGAKRLPDSARALGRSMRMFNDEMKGLQSDAPASGAEVPPPGPAPRFDSGTGAPFTQPGEQGSSVDDVPRGSAALESQAVGLRGRWASRVTAQA